MPENKQLSTAEVAARLGVSTDRVRQLDSSLNPERIGGRRVYDAAAVEKLRAQRARKAVR